MADLYRIHAPDGQWLAYLLTGSRTAAEDLVQDAFVKVYGRMTHLRRPDAFGPYLRRTIVNLARMQFRRRKVERRYIERQDLDYVDPGPGSSFGDLDDLRTGLMNLPYRQRAALVLRFYADLPDDQIADLLGCAAGTVRSLVSRGLTALRDSLGGDRDG